MQYALGKIGKSLFFDLAGNGIRPASAKRRRENRIKPEESPQHARHARNKFKLTAEGDGLHMLTCDEHTQARQTCFI